MIQLNLLPDVKLEYIKAQRSRRMAISVSLLVCAVTVTLLLLLLGAVALQKKHINDLTTDIAQGTKTLEDKKDVVRVLTVQNQLESLPELHNQKPAAARLFGFLNEVTPTQVSISELKVDFAAQTITLSGTADALSSVNKYIDTLKFTTYSVEGGEEKNPAFKDVVLTSFNLSSTSGSGTKPASYQIDLSYDPAIFSVNDKVTLEVPNTTTTRSTLSNPADLFQANTNKQTAGSR